MADKQKTGQSDLWYYAEFACRGISYEAVINGNKDSDDELILDIQGIPINVDLEGILYIDDIKNYTEEQLSFLSFEIDTCIECGELTNYYFKMNVPIELINIHSHTKVSECMIIELEDDSGIGSRPNASVSHHILTADSHIKDMESALHDMQEQLKDDYILCACACCKYGQGNPYCWCEYFNFLCFRKNKDDYLKFPNGVDKEDWEFFTNKNNAEQTRPMFCCEQFESSFFREE